MKQPYSALSGIAHTGYIFLHAPPIIQFLRQLKNAVKSDSYLF